MDARSLPQPDAPRLLARLWRFVKQLVLLAVITAAVAVAAWFYGYDRLDEQIRVELESRLRNHYQGLVVSVRSARRIEGQGIEIRGLEIREAGSPDAPTLVHIEEALAECDTKLPDFLLSPPSVERMHIRRMKLRAERKPNGFWSLAHLVPLPTFGGPAPHVQVSDASIEIIDPSLKPAASLTLRDIELSVQPLAANLIAAATAANDPSATSPAPSAAAEAASSTLLHIRGTLAGDHFETAEVDGLLDPDSGRWDLRGAVEGLEFSPRLRAALPRELAAMIEPLASVRGRTHFGFEVQKAALDPTKGATLPMQFTIYGKISEGRIDDARLPDPLTDVEATLRCDNRGLSIQELTARCGTTQLELSADVQGYSATSPMHLALHAQHLEVDRLSVERMTPELQAVWAKFSPRGIVDVKADLQFDGRRWIPDMTIVCHDLSVQYDGFPYRVNQGQGTIELKGNVLSTRMRCIGGGQMIECRADIRNPGEDFTGWVEIQSEAPVPLDEKLIAAMDYRGQRIVRMFQPKGAVSFQVRFQRDPGEPIVHRRLNVQLHDASIQYQHFPYPIDKLSGSLQMTDDDWVFQNLTGRNDSGYIVGHGHWLSDAPDGYQLTLNFTATDVPLEDELRWALSPGVQRLWTNLRPRGNIDHLGVQIRYGTDNGLSLAVQAQKWPPGQNVEGRSISVDPAWFRYRLDNLTGSFHYRDGIVELRNLTAVHGRGTIEAEGRCEMLADGSCRVQLPRLTADRVQVDHELLAAMPAGVGAALARLNLSSPLNTYGSVEVVVPLAAEQLPVVDWDLTFDIENGSLQAGLPIEHVHGGLKLVGRSTKGAFDSRGELRIDSAIVRDIQLTQIQGPIRIDSQRISVGSWAERDVTDRVPRQVTANVFGGLLSLDGEVLMTSEAPFRVQTTFENGDLAQIVREVAPRQYGLTGKVFGIVNLTGTGDGIHTYRGDGQIRLRDADIYELPVMISMLKMLAIQRPTDRTAFTTSNIDFRIEGDALQFDRIDFNGDAISLKGKGHMTGQRQVDLKFYTQVGRDEFQMPVFRPFLGEASREFMLVEVTGSLDNPMVNKTAFPRLNERLQQMFPELAARQREPEPMLPIVTQPRALLERGGLLPRRE